ncbi:MAG: glucosamine-6-phosphate deaminase [Planctomycetes bacterium]|nr:glucosamine-6-phosphate deaminase [Planctomycetota bacterium]
MEVVITDDYEKMSDLAAQIAISSLKDKPDMVLGLATGSTPIGLYDRLIAANQNDKIDFSEVTTFNLDEYVDLPPDHEQSYRYFMDEHLFNDINIPEENTYVPDGLAEDLGQYCLQYENMIQEAGGVDLQVLGIGRDGHLGFNEPGSSLASRTQVVALAPETIEDNSRFFESEDEVPRFAVTMGVHTILQARTCLLLASGESKADAVQGCIEGPITSQLTASALQLHPNAIVIVDEAAGSKLERLEYYKWVQEAKNEIADRL